MNNFSYQILYRAGAASQKRRLLIQSNIKTIPATNVAGPTLRQNSASRKATVLHRRYTPYEYQLMVAASQMQRGQGSAALSPLLSGLVAYWKLDETSGTRFDSVATNHLTDHNNVGSAIGKQATAALFDGATNWLSSSSPAFNFGDTDFSFLFWVYVDNLASVNAAVLGYWDALSGDKRQYLVTQDDLDHFVWIVSHDGLSTTSLSSSKTLTADAWYMVKVWHDAANDEIGIKVIDSGGTVTSDTTAHAGGIYSTTNDLMLGKFITSGGDRFSSIGLRVDELAVYSRITTDMEDSQLHNSGSGITYPFSS